MCFFRPNNKVPLTHRSAKRCEICWVSYRDTIDEHGRNQFHCMRCRIIAICNSCGKVMTGSVTEPINMYLRYFSHSFRSSLDDKCLINPFTDCANLAEQGRDAAPSVTNTVRPASFDHRNSHLRSLLRSSRSHRERRLPQRV